MADSVSSSVSCSVTDSVICSVTDSMTRPGVSPALPSTSAFHTGSLEITRLPLSPAAICCSCRSASASSFSRCACASSFVRFRRPIPDILSIFSCSSESSAISFKTKPGISSGSTLLISTSQVSSVTRSRTTSPELTTLVFCSPVMGFVTIHSVSPSKMHSSVSVLLIFRLQPEVPRIPATIVAVQISRVSSSSSGSVTLKKSVPS